MYVHNDSNDDRNEATVLTMIAIVFRKRSKSAYMRHTLLHCVANSLYPHRTHSILRLSFIQSPLQSVRTKILASILLKQSVADVDGDAFSLGEEKLRNIVHRLP